VGVGVDVALGMAVGLAVAVVVGDGWLVGVWDGLWVGSTACTRAVELLRPPPVGPEQAVKRNKLAVATSHTSLTRFSFTAASADIIQLSVHHFGEL